MDEDDVVRVRKKQVKLGSLPTEAGFSLDEFVRAIAQRKAKTKIQQRDWLTNW